jgi:fibronectin-binding autotransporter adhesin
VVSSGGVASGTVVSAGGNETVYAGGSVSGLTLNSGVTLTEVGLLISGVGATLTLAPITTQASNVNVPTTGTLSNVVSVVSATAIAGGTVVVSSGGAASVLTVDSDGSLIVSSGGVVSASNILSGGLETTDLGGLSIGAVGSAPARSPAGSGRSPRPRR